MFCPGGRLWSPQFLRDGERTKPNFGKTQNCHRRSPKTVSGIRYVASFWNCSVSKSKFRSNFALFDPCKIRGGLGKIFRVEGGYLRFTISGFVSRATSPNATGVENRDKISHFLAPAKFRGGVDEYLFTRSA